MTYRRIPPIPQRIPFKRRLDITVTDHFGLVDPTATGNSTTAFVNAAEAAREAGARLLIPNGSFLIDPETLVFEDIEVVGVRTSSLTGSRLRIASAGNWLVSCVGNVSLNNLFMNCNDLGQDVVVATDAVLNIKNCSAQNGTRYGWYLRRCGDESVVALHAQGNDSHGVYLSSCKNMKVEYILSFLNGGFAYFVDGMFRDSPEEDDNEGGLLIQYAQCEANTGGVAWYQGVEGLTQLCLRAEGSGDCIKIEDCHNCQFYDTTMAGGTAGGDKMVRIINSQNIFLSGIHNQNGSGSDGSPYFKIRHSPNAATNVGFLKENCRYMSSVATFNMGEENDP